MSPWPARCTACWAAWWTVCVLLLATSPSATAAAPSVVSEILSNRRRAVQASAGPRCVYANETCHAGRARDFACADGCGLCAPEPLPNELPVCTRPCGLHQLKMRGVGGKLVRESIGLAVFPRDAVTQSEGWTLGNAGTRRALDSAGAAGMKTVVVLRHPIARILGRYWFEGRWPLFAKDLTAETAIPFGTWLATAATRARGARVWTCVSNYYVKSLAGCGGAGAVCDAKDPPSKIGPTEQKAALAELRSFGVVLISEYLGAEAQLAMLAEALCYKWPRFEGTEQRGGATVPVPNVESQKIKRAAGGHSAQRPADWRPNETEQAALIDMNRADLALYEEAVRMVQARVAGMGWATGLGALPELAAPF